jgi:alginate O-acetyltransferase complex protein AlgJ
LVNTGNVSATCAGPVGIFADSFTVAMRYLGAIFTELTIVHPDAVDADPARAAQSFVDRDTAALEIVERNLGGGKGILNPGVIAQIHQALAARLPR